MKLSRQALTGSLLWAALLCPSFAPAQSRLRVERAASSAAPAASFSAEVPLVGRNVPAGNGQSNTLVLNAVHPFSVTLTATDVGRTGNSGPGVALPQTDLFGYFSIPALTFNPSNPEVFIKLLDGRAINGKYWVFFGGLTDLFYVLTVTENATGLVRTYTHAQGTALGGFDTSAFSATVSSNLENAKAIEILPASISRTSIDISNNTNTAITVQLQYAYTCTAPTCSPVGAFARTSPLTIPIAGLGGFHSDDIVQYLSTQPGITLNPGALSGSNGTFLVTFFGVPSNIGWEATVEARNYARVSEVDPLRGTVGFGENASLFFESTNTTLVGNARDTRSAPTLEGSLLTQIGIRNTDIFPTNPPTPANVDLTLYDPATGQRVGNTISLANILAGEVRLVNDLFTVAAVPSSVHSVILFADIHTKTPTSPTIEGFLLVQDTQSLDWRFHELKCADLVRCGP